MTSLPITHRIIARPGYSYTEHSWTATTPRGFTIIKRTERDLRVRLAELGFEAGETTTEEQA